MMKGTSQGNKGNLNRFMFYLLEKKNKHMCDVIKIEGSLSFLSESTISLLDSASGSKSLSPLLR